MIKAMLEFVAVPMIEAMEFSLKSIISLCIAKWVSSITMMSIEALITMFESKIESMMHVVLIVSVVSIMAVTVIESMVAIVAISMIKTVISMSVVAKAIIVAMAVMTEPMIITMISMSVVAEAVIVAMTIVAISISRVEMT